MSTAHTVEFETDFDLDVQLDLEVTEPGMWQVILHNDDVTPMDFVIQALIEIFHMTANTATEVMMNIHNNGSGVAGVYTYEIAEEKATHTITVARQNRYPLCVTIEPE